MDDLLVKVSFGLMRDVIITRTVGVLRWVLDSTMSKKSAAVGTGAMDLRPEVDIEVVVIKVTYGKLPCLQRKKTICVCLI